MKIYTSEIASAELTSDNPVHQRLFFGYEAAKDYVKGDVLEVGCGDGRGLDILIQRADHFTGIDKYEALTEMHQKRYPDSTFKAMHVPPFEGVYTDSFDVVISFHVIEHIKDDLAFISEIQRVLKPNGIAIITTPNKLQSLARNPWHIREYTADELGILLEKKFIKVERKGICGNDKVMSYHEKNRQSVNKIMRFDILNLQHILPGWLLQKPYDMMNRRNRKKLADNPDTLSDSIHFSDFFISDDTQNSLDHFFIAHKCDC